MSKPDNTPLIFKRSYLLLDSGYVKLFYVTKCLDVSVGQKALDHQFLVSLCGLLVKGIPFKVTWDTWHLGREASHTQYSTEGS